jgi:hypothetical protein
MGLNFSETFHQNFSQMYMSDEVADNGPLNLALTVDFKGDGERGGRTYKHTFTVTSG